MDDHDDLAPAIGCARGLLWSIPLWELAAIIILLIITAIAGCAYGPQLVIHETPPRHLPPVAWAPDCATDPTCVVLVNDGWRPLFVTLGPLPEFRMGPYSATRNFNFDFGRYDLRVEVEMVTALGVKRVPLHASPIEIAPTRRPRPIVLPTIK